MRVVLQALCALLTVLLGAGCLRPFEPCQFDGLVGDIAQCTDISYCFEDRDGDGIAGRYDAGTCGAEALLEGTYGDCDDEDDNNFPGNPEVCDGLDNDCDGAPNFDDEEDDVEPGELPNCAPGAEVGLFLRGGGSIGGQAVNGSVNSISLTEGASLGGVLKFRAIFNLDDPSDLAAVLTISWSPTAESLVPIWDPRAQDLPDPGASPFDFEVVLPDDFTAPVGAGEGPFYITIASADGSGAPHLAALSAPNYCCALDDCPPPEEGAPCLPVWGSDLEGFEDPDLGRLTELDLGGCATFGAASVNELSEALTPMGERCTIGEGQCVPRYRPKPVGCRLVPLLVEGGEE